MTATTRSIITKPPPVRDLAYEALRDLIARGEFQPNQRLTEVALALRLGVSRTPAREAMARLASEGYLVSGEGGFRIPIITADHIEKMSEVRELLEPEAARQAADNESSVGLLEMATAVADEAAAHEGHDTDGFVAANERYRSAWLKRSPNPLLLEALAKTMRSLMLIRRRTMQDAVLRAHILETHRGLLAAMQVHDGRRARRWQLERIRGFHRLIMVRLYEGAPD
jgi:DNA-binding GntR family transcriptional regulator